MAKISIEIDTVEKTAIFSKNGQSISDVESCSIYKNYDGKYNFSLHSSVYDEDEDMRSGSYLSASEHQKAVEFLQKH